MSHDSAQVALTPTVLQWASAVSKTQFFQLTCLKSLMALLAATDMHEMETGNGYLRCTASDQLAKMYGEIHHSSEGIPNG